MPIRILLYELHEDLLCDLRDALITARLVPAIEEKIELEAVDWSQYDLVFCPATSSRLREILEAASKRGTQPRVVAVNRLPEVAGWIESLELGAIDYLSPPFEQASVRWLLQTHFPSGESMAA